LVIELQKREIEVKNQIEIPVLYGNVKVGKHRIDLLIENRIILELKAIKNIEDVHFAIVKSYLRAFGLEHGLILNFAKTTLEIKRVIAKK
jgi:GxxExxY protein